MQTNNTRNSATVLRQFVVRAAPITHSPILVDANSLDRGRLKAVVDGREQEIGLEFYNASEPVLPEFAQKIVQAYAKQNNLSETSFLVRTRLPKSNAATAPRKARKSNDANLVLVKDEKKPAVEEKSLEQRVQEFHDSQTAVAAKRKAGESAPEAKKDEAPVVGAASPANPEGATVKRADAEKTRTKRKYERQSEKVRSAKSKAAYDRYVKELGKQIEASPTAMEAAVPGPGVSAEQAAEARLKFALKLADLLDMFKIM